ncbi:SDR family oxidoreductase [Owenweeksia hongkongensis]|uniref:SDR family oxidoreductase n=1 Tax=Owenweeksia hongkongensis TaxID=253245 RepID=UPI003A8E5A60
MFDQPYHEGSLADKSFLITGGAGFIGSNIVEYLLKYGASKVRVLDNLSNGYYTNIEEFETNPAFEFVEGDIRDLESCKKALVGIDYVSHQAALGSVPRSIEDPINTNSVNIDGFLNMLTAVKDSDGIKRMVYAASSSSYGDSPALPKVEGNEGNPLSPYAVTKWVNELYADVYSKVYGLHTVGLRYFNIFGPRQNPDNPYAAVIPLFMKAAIDGVAPKMNGDGETSRDFTFVENAVQANVKAMLNTENLDQHEACNIAVGDRTTLNQLWDGIAKAADTDLSPVYGPERPGDVKHSLADISKAKTILGYNPKFRIDDGLKIAFDYYKQNFG